MMRSCVCRSWVAEVTEIPGSVVGMNNIVPSFKVGMNSVPSCPRGHALAPNAAIASKIVRILLFSTPRISGR
jgi:hypothetical protein